jgi:hypothetical protein
MIDGMREGMDHINPILKGLSFNLIGVLCGKI